LSRFTELKNLPNFSSFFLPGLPEGICIFIPKFGHILEGLGMENIGIVYGHLECFVVFWYVFPLWYAVPGNIWQPCSIPVMSLVSTDRF
jgi:hypothetical protein